jgi:hypothetical protein
LLAPAGEGMKKPQLPLQEWGQMYPTEKNQRTTAIWSRLPAL